MIWSALFVQVSALILENTFTSILDMAGVLLPFLKWFIGGSGSKGPKILNFLVRSPWSTVDVVGEVRLVNLCSCCVPLTARSCIAHHIQINEIPSCDVGQLFTLGHMIIGCISPKFLIFCYLPALLYCLTF